MTDGATPDRGTSTPVGWTEAAAQATAWLLVVLVPIHVTATVLVDDGVTASAAEQLARWESPGWRLLDWLLVVVGCAHASAATWRATWAPGPGPRLGPAILGRSRAGRVVGVLVVGVSVLLALVVTGTVLTTVG